MDNKGRPEPLTDEQLRAVTVGELGPLDGSIPLAPYNADWPRMYATLERQIRVALGAQVLLLLEHVGSTSVPGLLAKPTIDMVMAVPDSADEGAYVAPLECTGFVLRIREPDWFEHRLLKSPGIDGNLHVFSRACAEIDRMLAFRDWLRPNDDDRMLYQRTSTSWRRVNGSTSRITPTQNRPR